MAKYDISREAAEDLYNIWEYTVDTWSEDQADKYYATLDSAFAEIAKAPGKTGKPCDEIMPGLRAYHVRRHMVFYTIFSANLSSIKTSSKKFEDLRV